MKHSKAKLITIVLFLSAVAAFILIPIEGPSIDTRNEPLTVVYFHNNICEACNEDARFIDIFNSAVGEEDEGVTIDFKIYNIFLEDGDYMFKSYCDKSKIPEEDRIAPIVFIGNSYLIGEGEIESSLRDVFLKEKAELLKN